MDKNENKEMIEAVALLAKEKNIGMHVHLSETESEHKGCLERYGMTPAEYRKTIR